MSEKEKSQKEQSVIKPGDVLFGYKVKRVETLPEINSEYFEFEHEATGARHLHIANQDKENTFSVCFLTAPKDSTGVAHILEHTALCGSEKFKVKDPFFSMLKRSLSTFMNAFTASDWTMYPFSTQNRKDFYNLMDVYTDAAFHPNLSRFSFLQEGHRMELETGDDGREKLVYKGVVYNEMKGAMSSQDQIMVRSILKALYPSTTYGNNSGGDPKVIPTLTHEMLLEFHRRFYHPSNSFFFTYGDLPVEDHLSYIDQNVLSRFSRIDPDSEVTPQPRWTEPRETTFHYPVGESEDLQKKSQVCVSWLTADVRNTFEVLSMIILEHVLLGNPASPLRKALIDSGLGSALSDGTGYDPDCRDTMFSCGLKEVEESKAKEIERIIFNTFRDLVDKGIEKELIDSAIHQIEFQRKEITNTPYPYGLKVFLTLIGPWLHKVDPLKILKFDKDLEEIRKKAEQGGFFEGLIEKYFLTNPHRVLLKLVPDPEMEAREKIRVERELEDKMSRMSEKNLDALRADMESLKQFQEAPEDPSVLPTLTLKDIPPEVTSVTENSISPKDRAYRYHRATSGIFYFTSAAGLGGIDPDLLPLVPFFSRSFSKIGTKKRNYVELARAIDARTGGMGMAARVRTSFDDSGRCIPFVSFNGKCLYRNQNGMFEIIRELFSEIDFSNTRRMKELLLEYRAALESSVVQNGHRYAQSLAARNFSVSLALSEMFKGIHQLRFIREITDNLDDTRLEKLSSDLARIAGFLFAENNVKMALIGEEQAVENAGKDIELLIQDFQESGPNGFVPPDITPGENLPREGWHTSTAVSFVIKSFRVERMHHEDAPALAVMAKLLRSLFLHREIREKGGAYGGFSNYDPEDGIFSFGSYRDPRIVETLDVYEKAVTFIRSGDYNEKDITEGILQVCSDIDRPSPPGPAAGKAFYRKLIGLSDDLRQDFKKRLLAVNRENILGAAERHFRPDRKDTAVVVISSRDKLDEANKNLGDFPLELHSV